MGSKNTWFLQDVRIEKIIYGWVGLATLGNGKKVLVKGGALPGSVVDCRIVKRRKDYVEAHIVMVKSYDPAYADGEIFCPHYYIPLGVSKENEKTHKIGCGWCKWQILSYQKQLEIKESIVRESFRKLDGIDFLPIVPSPLIKGYRNKIEFSFGKYISQRDDLHAEWNLWFHKQGEFSKIVDVDNCGLIDTESNKLYEYMKKLCSESGIPVYDQMRHSGFFRHLVLRRGVNTDQFLINLAVADGKITDEERTLWDTFVANLKKDEYLTKTVNTFVVTYNNGLADIIRSDHYRTELLRGDGYMFEKLLFPTKDSEEYAELNFRISPYSFFQTNTVGAQQLFWHAAQMIWLLRHDTILDLYCGAGSIGLSFLKMGIGKSVIGIETVSESISDAWHNAKINGMEEHAMFLVAQAEKMFVLHPQLTDKCKNLGLIIVDPPREWLHKNVVDFLIRMKQEYQSKILYISCNPVTMARDIELFAQAEIHCKTLQAVDMFPHTHHIEVIGVL